MHQNRVRSDRTELIKISKYLKSSDSANPSLIRFGSVSEKSSRISLYRICFRIRNFKEIQFLTLIHTAIILIFQLFANLANRNKIEPN